MANLLYLIRKQTLYYLPEKIAAHQLIFRYTATKKRSSTNGLFLTWTNKYSNYSSAITDSTFFDDIGRRKIYPINLPNKRVFKIDFDARYTTQLNKHLFQVSYLMNYQNTMVPGYINSVYTVSRYSMMDNRIAVNYSFSDFLTTELIQSVLINKFSMSTSSGQFDGNNLYKTSLNSNYIISKRFILSNSLNYNTNGNQNPGIVLWNMYLTSRLLKSNQIELKFSAFDILKKYKNLVSLVGYNTSSTIVNSGLQQFFMLSVAYYPRYFGKKE